LVIERAETEISAGEIDLFEDAVAVAVLLLPFVIAGAIFGDIGRARDDDLIGRQASAAVLLDQHQHLARMDDDPAHTPEVGEVNARHHSLRPQRRQNCAKDGCVVPQARHKRLSDRAMSFRDEEVTIRTTTTISTITTKVGTPITHAPGLCLLYPSIVPPRREG